MSNGHMITYSVSRYAGKRTRLTKSVRLTGWFCTVTGVGPENLPENVRNVFEPSRDEGYWLRKYIIIYQKIMELDYDYAMHTGKTSQNSKFKDVVHESFLL